MKRAILVIDVQRALTEGKYAMFEADAVINRINSVLARARVASVLPIFIQHASTDGVLDHGSTGWQFAPALQLLPGDHVVGKTTPDSFHKTDLLALLQRENIGELLICGFQSDFCVDTTTRSALRLGYPVTLISDGHSTLDNEALKAADIVRHHNITLSNIESFGPRVSLMAAAEISFSL